MTDYVVTKDWPDSISFDRLHALAMRGYRAKLGVDGDDSGFSRIDLVHPKSKGKHLPPRVTLWSNGILSTRDLLWPAKYVPLEEGPPEWQKFIDTGDREKFDGFLSSVPLPNALDLYVYPFVLQAKVFAARFMFGATLCLILGFGSKMCLRPILKI